VGGYSKIATVASVDLPRLGRLLPGQMVRLHGSQPSMRQRGCGATRKRGCARAIADMAVARPPGGIDLARLYEKI